MKAMADNKYNFWYEICDIFVQNMVHFSSQLDKRLSTKYMQFIALGNILMYTFTLHTSDNNKEEYQSINQSINQSNQSINLFN
jgi:hypothetical protein